MRNGTLRIQVVEGRINQIIIRDPDKTLPSNNYILRYAERLKASQPLKQSELERYLLLLNDFPGLRVSGVLSPAQKSRGTLLAVEVSKELAAEMRRRAATGCTTRRRPAATIPGSTRAPRPLRHCPRVECGWRLSPR